MEANAQQVIEDPTPSRGAVLALRIAPLAGVAVIAGVLGYALAGIAGALIGLIGAAAYADHTLRKARRELDENRAGQRVFDEDWAAAPSVAHPAAQPAEVRRWVGPRPGSAADGSRWLVAGRDPRQVAYELRGRR